MGTEPDTIDPVVCRDCGAKLWAISNIQVCHPWPMAKLNKQAIKRKDVSVVADEQVSARPFCTTPDCPSQGVERSPARTRTEMIQDLMRELINRGMSPNDIQTLVRGHVSAIDLLAATYPRASWGDA